ncbi:MAG: DUF6452 family protein [Polaribacter sp.]|nr:DUF6452 family protein [Polaribacter sp.]
MKKTILFLFLLTLAFSACEKDDICLLPNTPNLILRFYDSTDLTEVKSVDRLSIWADGKDTISNYKSVTLDSIVIPLNVNATETVYHFKMNSTSGNVADNKYNKITITYTPEDVYVSRSCGYKTIFNDVSITSDNGWVHSFTPSTLTTIDHETAAHVQIFH